MSNDLNNTSITSKVHVSRPAVMADGSIRLYIDLLPGTPEELAAALRLREKESFMILSPVDDVLDTVSQFLNQMTTNGTTGE